jgi:hypothetical protein
MNIIILVQLIFVKKNISCYYIPQNVLSLAKAVSLERSKSSDIRSDQKPSAWPGRAPSRLDGMGREVHSEKTTFHINAILGVLGVDL